MSNHDLANQLIQSFSGQRNIITVPAVYVQMLEEYPAAILLNQIVYWSDKTTAEDGFFFKSYDEFKDEIFLSKYQISRATSKLKEKNLVQTKLQKVNGIPILHYKIDMDALSNAIVKFLNNGKSINLTMESEESRLSSYTEDYLQKTTSRASSEKIPYSEIISFLNQVTNKKYKVTQKWKDLIKARWNEGQRLDDFKKVINVKSSQWLNDSNMNKYLRPQTLFGNKFDDYLQEYREPIKPKQTKNDFEGLEDLFGDPA